MKNVPPPLPTSILLCYLYITIIDIISSITVIDIIIGIFLEKFDTAGNIRCHHTGPSECIHVDHETIHDIFKISQDPKKIGRS